MVNPVYNKQAARFTPSAVIHKAKVFPAQFTNDKIAHCLLKGSLCWDAVIPEISASSIVQKRGDVLQTVERNEGSLTKTHHLHQQWNAKTNTDF